ncbi:MAG: lysophospholipid acyltransferase family protein [Candidatus Helarchaeales archaeon]
MASEKRTFIEKVIHINLFGNVDKAQTHFQSTSSQDSFLNPYAHPVNKALVRYLHRKKLLRFTRKIPFIVTYLFSMFFAFMINLDKKFVKDTKDNVEFVLKKALEKHDEKTREKIKRYYAFEHFKFMGRLWFEDMTVFLSFSSYPWDIPKYVQEEGFEKLDEALSRGKGVILLMGHHGHHMITTSYLGYKGYKVNQLVDVKTVPAIIPDLSPFLNIIDAREGDPETSRQINKVLERREILIWLSDAGYKNFPYVKFFSELCRSPVGVAAKALKFDCPVLPIWIEMEKRAHKWKVYIGDEIKLIRDPSIPKKKLILKNTRIINKALEKIILKNLPAWSFLCVVHNTKRISKTFKVKGTKIKTNLLEELNFFEELIKNSHEEGREDEKLLNVLAELKSKLDDL